MNNPRLEITFDLVAAIKFSAKNDGILVPIYSCYPKNEYFVAQTDDSMMIRHFSELDTLLDHLVPVNYSTLLSSSYCVGDFSPLIVSINNDITVIEEDNLSDLVAVLERPELSSFDLVQEILSDLRSIMNSLKIERPKDDLIHTGLAPETIQPKAARLWLDVAVEDLDDRYGTKIENERIKSKVRMLLLSWATKTAELATTPIFEHFVWSVKKVERRGVYVEDILATAIVNRATEAIARSDKLLRLISNFRSSYGRAPLSSVLELSHHHVPVLAEWAVQSLDDYYEYVRKNIDTAKPEEIARITFAADGGDHWPPDLEKKLSRMVMAHQKELNSALSERRAIMETIERGRKDGAHRFDRHAVHRRVATLSLQILTTVKFLDVLRKSLLSGEELERSGGTLHDVDYSGLGLNQDFFMNLGNSDENA